MFCIESKGKTVHVSIKQTAKSLLCVFKFSSSKSQVPSSKVLQVQVCIRSSSSPFLCVCSPSPVKVFVSSLLSGVVDSHKSILSSLYYPPTTKSSCSTVKTWIICNKRGRFLFSISSLCVVFLQRLLVEWMFCSFCTWFPSYWVFSLSSCLCLYFLPSSILHKLFRWMVLDDNAIVSFFPLFCSKALCQQQTVCDIVLLVTVCCVGTYTVSSLIVCLFLFDS